VGSSGSEVFWGIVSAFIAFLLGLAWRRLTQGLVNFRARRFWRPLIGENMHVVLGRFRELPGFEASGVVGAGDNIALKDLADYFTRIGFKRFTVLYNDQFGWSDTVRSSPMQGNLILLGGPDANRLTREVLERITLGIEFLEVSPDYLQNSRNGVAVSSGPAPSLARRVGSVWPLSRWGRASRPEWRVPVFLDKVEDTLHGPVMSAKEIRSDCGVLIRCPNPFNTAREVMIFCGSYGYGTWAAVQFSQSKEFLERVPKRVRFIECVLTVDVVREMPQNIQVALLRPLDEATLALASQAYLRVPRIVS
jgi:hypothetical protein